MQLQRGVGRQGLTSTRQASSKPVAVRGKQGGRSARPNPQVLQAQAFKAEKAASPATTSYQQNGTALATGDGFAVSASDAQKTVLSIILGGGAGSRLYPLTKNRAKPAVPLGANYRLIDIPVSNCINSGINKIYCLTQFNSASLNRHISQAYNNIISSVGVNRGFVEVLAASQTTERKDWFQGTADAVRQYLWLFEESVSMGVEDYLILSGDHLYRMDYRDFVRKHRESGAAITIAALPCEERVASAFGIMKIDESGQVVEFAEKPKGDALHNMRVDTTVLGVDPVTAAQKPYIASMGIYVINARVLRDLLKDQMPNANDFGNEVIPGAKDAGYKVQAYAFEGYWEDIGTIDAFYNANLALVKPGRTAFSFYDKDAPIYTMSRFLPPSKVVDAEVNNCVIGDGTVIKAGSRLSNCVVGLRSLINEDCVLEDTLMMGADFYETQEECRNVLGCLPMGVGRGTKIRKAIIDKNARIGSNCQIINKEGVREADMQDKGFVIKDGIVVVIKGTEIPNNTTI